MSAHAATTHSLAPLVVDELPARRRFAQGLAALKRLRDDPDDTELALRASLLLNFGSLRRALHAFQSCEEGRGVLRARPALDRHVDLNALSALPENTLGHAYSRFLARRGLTPEPFVPPSEVRDEHLRYISQRMRQTHDLWHVVTGYDTDVMGEIELQAFSFGQLRTPFAFFVALGGVLKAAGARARLAARVLRAYRRARRAEPLCYRAWEQRFATPLADVRRELALD